MGGQAHDDVMQDVRDELSALRREIAALRASVEQGHGTEGDLWSKNDVAERLGVSPKTVDRHVQAGHFPEPAVRVGRAPRWTAGQIEDILRAVGSGRGPRSVRARDAARERAASLERGDLRQMARSRARYENWPEGVVGTRRSEGQEPGPAA